MPSASTTSGMSLRTSCSCSAIVPVEITTFLPERSAGTRYASDLPTPVPASTTVCDALEDPALDQLRHLHLPGRASKPASACAIGPCGPKRFVERHHDGGFSSGASGTGGCSIVTTPGSSCGAMRCAYAMGCGSGAMASRSGRYSTRPHNVPAISPPMWP